MAMKIRPVYDKATREIRTCVIEAMTREKFEKTHGQTKAMVEGSWVIGPVLSKAARESWDALLGEWRDQYQTWRQRVAASGGKLAHDTEADPEPKRPPIYFHTDRSVSATPPAPKKAKKGKR